MNNDKLCEYNKYVIQIQSCYKGYYTRKKLNIYYNLPRDLQRKIIWHINKDIYLKHFYCSIFKIIQNRYKNFYNNPNYTKIIYKIHNIEWYINDCSVLFKNFMIDFYSLIDLSIKYHTIIDVSKIYNYLRPIVTFNKICIVFMFNSSDKNKLIHYNSLFQY